jgi:hypothetical protein
VVQADTVRADIYYFGGHQAAVRSACREQARRISPLELLHYTTELAELADFCTADTEQAYRLYRAGAWASKSALMSWFVLHPPPGVRIVVRRHRTVRRPGRPRRVRRRGAGAVNRTAGPADARLPDRCHLRRPSAWHAGRRATACAERGERLILVVDGLDEDRGVTTGPDAQHRGSAAGPTPPRACG